MRRRSGSLPKRGIRRRCHHAGRRLRTTIHFRQGEWPWPECLMVVAATTGPLLLVTAIAGPSNGIVALCGGFAALYGLGTPLARRASIVAAAGLGMTAVMVTCSLLNSNPWAAALVLALTAALATFVIEAKDAGQPGMIMFLVTGSVALGLPPAADGVLHRGFLTGIGAVIALLMSLVLLVVRPALDHNPDSSPVRLEDAPARRFHRAQKHAAGMGIATLATGILFVAAGATHWYWAPISTAAVLQATDTSTILYRAVQRSGGTIIGVLVTALILMAHPSFIAIVLMCAGFLGASQLLFARNYALGIMCITPLALLLPGIADSASTSGTLLQRMWITVLGALLAALMWHVARRVAGRHRPRARSQGPV